MHVDLDHFFVGVTQGAPEAQRLIDFGLSEGAANQHPGQGTANRRFFFHNAFLELVWVEDRTEATSALVEPTRLWERCSLGGGASPFGICFRPRRAGSGPPFNTWPYRPPYLPQPLAIEMGANCGLVEEPLLFFLSFGRRPDTADGQHRQPMEHASGLRSMTRLRVPGPPHDRASAELKAAELACPWLSIAPGGEQVAEIGFDGEAAGHSHDFRPLLPLVFRW